MQKLALALCLTFSFQAVVAMNAFKVLEESAKGALQIDRYQRAITEFKKRTELEREALLQQLLQLEFETAKLRMVAFKEMHEPLVFAARQRAELEQFDYDAQLRALDDSFLREDIQQSNSQLRTCAETLELCRRNLREGLEEIAALRLDIPSGMYLYWVMGKHMAGETIDWAAEHKLRCAAIVGTAGTTIYVVTRLVRGKPVVPWGLLQSVGNMLSSNALTDRSLVIIEGIQDGISELLGQPASASEAGAGSLISQGAEGLQEMAQGVTSYTEAELRAMYDVVHSTVRYYLKEKKHDLDWCVRHGYLTEVVKAYMIAKGLMKKHW